MRIAAAFHRIRACMGSFLARGLPSVQVANEFVRVAENDGNEICSAVKLIKLVYIAHGYHMAIFDKPLIRGKVEAWKYGPMVPDLYSAFENQIGLNRPLLPMKTRTAKMSEDAKVVIEKVWKNYGRFSWQQLSDMTHEARTPWHETAAGRGLYSKIDNALIKRYYDRKIEDARQRPHREKP